MFKHFLMPTDGSALSQTAIERGVQLAKSLQAKVTGISVMPQFHMLAYQTEMVVDTEAQFVVDCKAHAEKNLAAVGRAARSAGVACTTVLATSDHPFELIIRTAQEQGCDLIVMASHGRRGVRGLLLGSETHKVLTHSTIPVLVFR